MCAARRVLQADLTWIGKTFEPGVRVTVGADGAIQGVSRQAEGPSERLQGKALLPGFVNVHSHAFQRGLRGRGETFPKGAGSFWSWREQMYALVSELDEERLYRLSLQCYREMLAAGITTVGEFHYLHHASEEADFALDEAVLRAAAEAGIRIVLLQTYYRTGGIGRPLEGAQRRFHTPNPDAYWRQMDRLGKLLDARTQSLGAAVHSVRAAPLEEIREIHQEARRRGLVFHMHLEEQRQEIEQCREAYGVGPLALINRELEIGPEFTAIHCTHSEPDDLREFFQRGASVCVCPLTEANLGDGIPGLPLEAGAGRVCLGTDSNARISMLEEMRWLEYGQRLQREKRGVWLDGDGNVARRLLDCATKAGAHALGVNAGRIEPGALADFAAPGLDHPSLAGVREEHLLEGLVFGSGDPWHGHLCP